MIETSNEIKHISAALLTFQGAVDGVGKTKENTAFRGFKYATLENVHDTAVPELQKVGVVYLQSAGAIVDGVMAMTTRLIHPESGEWIQGTMDICLGKRDPQGVGSASTYAARYSLMAMLGLPPIDDDGEAAIDRNNSRPEPAEQPKTLVKDQREIWKAMREELDACGTLDELGMLWGSPAFKAEFKKLKPDWAQQITDHKDARKADLSGPPRATVPPNFEGMPT
jgi:hypothetical protein